MLSAAHSNEDNFALAKLAKLWGAQVFVAVRPLVPARADGKLRVADVNPNAGGVKAIVEALGLATKPAYELEAAGLRALVVLGDLLPNLGASATSKLKSST